MHFLLQKITMAKDGKSLLGRLCYFNFVYSIINTTVHRCRLIYFQYYCIFMCVEFAIVCCHAFSSSILLNQANLFLMIEPIEF